MVEEIKKQIDGCEADSEALYKMAVELEGEDYPGLARQRERNAESKARGDMIKKGMDMFGDEVGIETLAFSLAKVTAKRERLQADSGKWQAM